MQKLTLAGIALMLCLSANAVAQESYADRVKRYIETYKEMAVAEQQRSGIPAAITLGQGIYETSAGASELATQANNHFGIKCKKEWRGETFAHTDDAPNECFRKYGSAAESYRDHSDYLKNSPRYKSCFEQQPTDYAAWAHHLKRCGYATNPQYAQRLIKIIEDFHLQDFTMLALNAGPGNAAAPVIAAAEVVPQTDAAPPSAPVSNDRYAYSSQASIPAPENVTAVTVEGVKENTEDPAAENTSGIVTLNGLKGFYARKGDVLLEQAIRYNVRYARLLEMNDLPDAPLAADMFVYLERKNTRGAHDSYRVQQGESLVQIAQKEGIQLKQLRSYNQLDSGEEPAPGTLLQLQKPVAVKPAVVRSTNREQTKKFVATHDDTFVPTGNALQRETAPAAPATETATAQPVAYRQNNTTLAERPQAAPAATVNIANETAVEEEDNEQEAPAAPASQEPQDELAQLKAKLDKAVYGSGNNAAGNQAAPAPAPGPHTEATTAASYGKTQYYTVQKGDTAFSIARKHNISMRQLMDWNQLNFDAIRVGQKLKVSP